MPLVTFYTPLKHTKTRSLRMLSGSTKRNQWIANITKWSNTHKQFVGNLPTNCLSVFGHFVITELKALGMIWISSIITALHFIIKIFGERKQSENNKVDKVSKRADQNLFHHLAVFVCDSCVSYNKRHISIFVNIAVQYPLSKCNSRTN